MIRFFVEDIDFKVPFPRKSSAWLGTVAGSYAADTDELNYIFVSDNYLLELNQQYLQHDTLTDIITFPHDHNTPKLLSGDIYISVERVRENADSFGVGFETELRRVLSHGMLHLIGFKDKTPAEEKKMRAAEDAALALFPG